MKAVIFPNFSKNNACEITGKVCGILLNMGFSVYADKTLQGRFPCSSRVTFGDVAELAARCDVIIAIGGDGTILEASAFAAENDRPLLGINTGRLGFMASMESGELYDLSKLLSGDYKAENRMMLECEHITGNGSRRYTALNDVVIASKYSQLTDFSVSCGEIEISTVRADGLIFSTPTGSTAYALSAGGPILDPALECIQMTPVCPQSLFARTMLLSADKCLAIASYPRERGTLYISVDGVIIGGAEAEDGIIIRRSEKTLRLIDMKGGSFYSAVNRKLMNSIK